MTTPPRVGVAVLGASGYTGAELVRLLLEHPQAKLVAITSRQYAGQRAADVLPGLCNLDLAFEDDASEAAQWARRGVEVVFSALPHGAFAARAQSYLDAGLKVIDLSADFRLADATQYPVRYRYEHPNPALLARAAYGLVEWNRDALAKSTFVANPGCYPTAVGLGLVPALRAGWWSGAPIVANAVSGVSGAGRSPTLGTHFVEVGNSVAPYKVGESHVHVSEIRQTVQHIGLRGEGAHPRVVFNPHLVPMARGILATLSVDLRQPISQEDALSRYQRAYEGCAFVRVLTGDHLPQTRHVRGSNRCDIAVRVACDGHTLLVFSAIDNLVKGAAGQAIQNWNVMQGYPESMGLPVHGMSCA